MTTTQSSSRAWGGGGASGCGTNGAAYQSGAAAAAAEAFPSSTFSPITFPTTVTRQQLGLPPLRTGRCSSGGSLSSSPAIQQQQHQRLDEWGCGSSNHYCPQLAGEFAFEEALQQQQQEYGRLLRQCEAGDEQSSALVPTAGGVREGAEAMQQQMGVEGQAMSKTAVGAAAASTNAFSRSRGRHTVVCRHWLKGMCMKGDFCDFLHQLVYMRMPLCRNQLWCTDTRRGCCFFKHAEVMLQQQPTGSVAAGGEEEAPAEQKQQLIVPQQQQQKECLAYFLGFCKLGPKCRRKHTPRHRTELPRALPSWYLSLVVANASSLFPVEVDEQTSMDLLEVSQRCRQLCDGSQTLMSTTKGGKEGGETVSTTSHAGVVGNGLSSTTLTLNPSSFCSASQFPPPPPLQLLRSSSTKNSSGLLFYGAHSSGALGTKMEQKVLLPHNNQNGGFSGTPLSQHRTSATTQIFSSSVPPSTTTSSNFEKSKSALSSGYSYSAASGRLQNAEQKDGSFFCEQEKRQAAAGGEDERLLTSFASAEESNTEKKPSSFPPPVAFAALPSSREGPSSRTDHYSNSSTTTETSSGATYGLCEVSVADEEAEGSSWRSSQLLPRSHSSSTSTTSVSVAVAAGSLEQSSNGRKSRNSRFPGFFQPPFLMQKQECMVPLLVDVWGRAASPLSRKRFFVIKCNKMNNICLSVQYGVWATSKANTKKLDAAFAEAAFVLLLFSANESGGFQGFARMVTSSTHHQPQLQQMQQLRLPALPPLLWGPLQQRLGGNFRVQWLKQCKAEFEDFGKLVNAWNDNLPLKKSRDGTELPPALGVQLCSRLAQCPSEDLLAATGVDPASCIDHSSYFTILAQNGLITESPAAAAVGQPTEPLDVPFYPRQQQQPQQYYNVPR